MRMRHPWYLLHRRYSIVLTLTLLLVTACSRPAPPVETRATAVSLDQVRLLAGIALDGTVPGKERQQARDDAMGTLVAFLKRSESRDVARADWEKPLKGGSRILRSFESGPVRVYSLTLPASGVVPPGERLAVQFLDGPLQANELTVMAGGTLVAARTLSQAKGQLSLTLAFSLARGGGYVAQYQRDSKTGEFKPAGAAFKGVPARVGEVGLEQRDGFLVVNTPLDGMWRPQFEQNQPLRLFLTSDIALDWKDRFELLDERNFNAFQGLATALDAKVSPAQRKEAWEKATHKLAAYLQEMPSWTDDIAPQLPPGGVMRAENLANLEVRVVSVPPPDISGISAFTVVQYRLGNGLPSAQVVALPGVVADLRLVNHNGLPELLLLSNPPGPANLKRAAVTLLRLSGDNSWAPASDWLGSLPAVPGLRMSAEANQLVIEGDSTTAVALARATEPAAQPGVEVCSARNRCFTLTWAGQKLSGGGWLVARLKELAASRVTDGDQMLQTAEAVRQFLQTPEARALPANELAVALGRGQGVAMSVFEVGGATRVVGMPPNMVAGSPVLIQSEGGVLLEPVGAGAVTEWVGAREVVTGDARWLLVLGRSAGAATVLLYRWDGKQWQPANALDRSVDRLIVDRARLSYSPGQTQPVRGLYVSSSGAVTAAFTPDGQGVRFCETTTYCATYGFTNGWTVK